MDARESVAARRNAPNPCRDSTRMRGPGVRWGIEAVDAGDVLGECVEGAWEGEFAPWQFTRRKRCALECFVGGDEDAADDFRRVDDDCDRPARIRIDVQQAGDPHFEAGFFERFAPRRILDALAAIDVAAGNTHLP